MYMQDVKFRNFGLWECGEVFEEEIKDFDELEEILSEFYFSYADKTSEYVGYTNSKLRNERYYEYYSPDGRRIGTLAVAHEKINH